MYEGMHMCFYGSEELKINCLENPVDVDNPDELKEAAQNAFLMIQIMNSMNGIGLSANQVGLDVPIFVWEYKGNNGIAINPSIEINSEDPGVPLEGVKEACLSAPGVEVPMTRQSKVTLNATAVDGTPYAIDSSGLLATIFQHEMDHLNGVCIVDFLNRQSRRKLSRVFA